MKSSLKPMGRRLFLMLSVYLVSSSKPLKFSVVFVLVSLRAWVMSSLFCLLHPGLHLDHYYIFEGVKYIIASYNFPYGADSCFHSHSYIANHSLELRMQETTWYLLKELAFLRFHQKEFLEVKTISNLCTDWHFIIKKEFYGTGLLMYFSEDFFLLKRFKGDGTRKSSHCSQPFGVWLGPSLHLLCLGWGKGRRLHAFWVPTSLHFAKSEIPSCSSTPASWWPLRAAGNALAQSHASAFPVMREETEEEGPADSWQLGN